MTVVCIVIVVVVVVVVVVDDDDAVVAVVCTIDSFIHSALQRRQPIDSKYNSMHAETERRDCSNEPAQLQGDRMSL
jgi:hypothetical protein